MHQQGATSEAGTKYTFRINAANKATANAAAATFNSKVSSHTLTLPATTTAVKTGCGSSCLGSSSGAASDFVGGGSGASELIAAARLFTVGLIALLVAL